MRKHLPLLGVVHVTRREFLGSLAVAIALPAVESCTERTPSPDAGPDASLTDATPPDAYSPPPCDAAVTSGFLTDVERRTLAALADYVLPPEAAPGGAAMGAVQYVENLLSAFDVDPPRIFAGGPYSGRQPFPDPAGGVASTRFPENDFARFLPLSRAEQYAWRLYLYGSAGMPGGGPNDVALGPVEGLRARVRNGLCAALRSAPGPIASLDRAALTSVWSSLPQPFGDELLGLILEAAFAAPEYGGNRDLAGWRLAHFEGDSQPLGYSIYDATAMMYRDRPGAPNVAANPGPDPDPMDADTRRLVASFALLLGGRVTTG